jgi:hypothetical protein
MPPQQTPQDDDLEVVQHPVLGPLKFPKDMPPEERNEAIDRAMAARKAEPKAEEGDSFLRQAGGALYRQAREYLKGSVAPWTEGFEAQEEAKKAGLSRGQTGLYIGAREINALAGHPFERAQELMRIPEEYRGRREAGYGPLYSAAAPVVAPQVGVNLEEMERQARLGHPRGVLAEAAVPAAEAGAGYLIGLRGGRGARPAEPAGEPLRELPKVGEVGGLPGPGAPVPPEAMLRRAPTNSQMDAKAWELFRARYDDLSAEEKLVVMRNVGGGPPGGVERRITRGEAPGAMEQRAERMPLPTRSPEAGAGATPPGTLPIARPGPPAAPPATTLGGGEVPRATLDEILRQATGQRAPERPTPGEPLRRGQPSEEGRAPPVVVDPLKQEFPDAAVRRLARANGAELLRAAGENLDQVQAVHDLTNIEIRQAAINAGIDVGQRHVGSRMLLGEGQITRQDLIDQMIRQGVKPADIPRLARQEPVGYTKPMAIPEKNKNTKFGITEPFIHHHELAHVVVGGKNGLDPGAVASHRHPLNPPNISASVLFDFSQFKTGGNFDRAKLAGGVGEKVLEMLAAGHAAGEVIDGMPKDVNFSASGDKRLAAKFLAAMGVPKYDWVKMWDAAYDGAKAKLTPEAVAIMKDEATRREDNLPVIYHYSENRVQHILERVADAEQQAKTGGGYAGAVNAEAYRGGQQTLPFPESLTPQGPVRPIGAQKLGAFKPPQNTYRFSVFGREGGGEQQIELQALNRKEAWKKLDRQGGYLHSTMLSETKPEVGPPITTQPEPVPAMSQKKIEDFYNSRKQSGLFEGVEDELEFLAGRGVMQRNVIKIYERMKPMMDEMKNVVKAGTGFGGWWQRFLDTFKVLGKTDDAAMIERLGQSHEDGLKAFHSAVSGNKNVEQANPLAWGAYREWLEKGQPTDRRSINRIAEHNNGIAGISANGTMYLDTGKLWNLVNSPQFKKGAPMTGEAFLRSPVAGTPGARKIPSMVGGTAGAGNWMRIVFDTHMRDLFGFARPLGDAAYIAVSIHIREVAQAMGKKGMQGQEQMWGVVLGLKSLLAEGMKPGEAAQAFGKGVMQKVGKDYAKVVAESIQSDPRVAAAARDLQKWGLRDILSQEVWDELEKIVQQGQEQLAGRFPRIDRALLERSARRIQKTMRERLRIKRAAAARRAAAGGGEEE